MKLAITHVSTYTYDTPVHYALQQLRLKPRQGHGQTVHSWDTTVTGGKIELNYLDPFLNHTDLVNVTPGSERIEIVSQGLIEVQDNNGVIGSHAGCAPLWLFAEATALTAPGNHVRQLAARVRDETTEVDAIARMHRLSSEIAEMVRYEAGHTDAGTTAEMALTAGHGVCQDHAHIMIAAARVLGHPARYVSGYLYMEDRDDQDASHAWCEVWTEPLGWIGFDVANGISPDARYVRVATGRDYTDAAPINGLRQGTGGENLTVSLQVQQ